MRHPRLDTGGWRTVLRINTRMALAALILFFGWLVWQMASLKWWGFYLLGPMCFLAGGMEAGRALFEAIRFLRNKHAARKFGDIGSDPRADRMARDSDFDLGAPRS